jgi:hypothetical protein
MLVYVVNEIDSALQLLSSGWSMLVLTAFKKVYFHHSITSYQAGVSHSLV